ISSHYANPMTASIKVFDIPELTTLIANNLSQHDLTFCCLVSKFWFDTFTPHLWHSITFRGYDATPKFRSPEGRAGLVRNGHHIRVLRATSLDLLEPFVEYGQTCTNIVSLDGQSIGRTSASKLVPRTAAMVSKSRRGLPEPGQRQDTAAPVQGAKSPVQKFKDGKAILMSILERNPQLEFVVVPSHCMVSEDVLKLAEESLLSLKEFFTPTDLRSSEPAINFSLFRKTVLQPHTQPTPALTGVVHPTERMLSRPLMKNYPRLMELQLDLASRINHDELEAVKFADKMSINSLEIDGCGSHQAAQVCRQILMIAPPLKSIEIFSVSQEGSPIDSSVISAFLKHAPTLQFLNVGGSYVNEETLQCLLCSCHSLKMFWTMSHDLGIEHTIESKLSALEVIKSPWVCNTLEVLKCKIASVPRPDIAVVHIGDYFAMQSWSPTLLSQEPPEPSALQASRNIQRKVLMQLGQLIHLRTLCLGTSSYPYTNREYSQLQIKGIGTVIVDGTIQTDCLELSLESGLDELAGLKELEEIVVYRMAHRIGVEEVQWMVENWPKLKKISGLQYESDDNEIN
ncbi:hypothetical protein BGZ95_001591, partial [Linnemannia exigua]